MEAAAEAEGQKRLAEVLEIPHLSVPRRATLAAQAEEDLRVLMRQAVAAAARQPQGLLETQT